MIWSFTSGLYIHNIVTRTSSFAGSKIISTFSLLMAGPHLGHHVTGLFPLTRKLYVAAILFSLFEIGFSPTVVFCDMNPTVSVSVQEDVRTYSR